jgi:hypothetical protein
MCHSIAGLLAMTGSFSSLSILSMIGKGLNGAP